MPLSVEQLEARNLLSATLLTDKADYAPGETAVITGSGFEVGETIQLQVVRTDGIPDYPAGNQPWQVTDGGNGDLDGRADGNLQTTWFVENQYSGATLLVLATGQTSGATAQAAFSDAPDTTGPAATILSISPNPAHTPPTLTATIDDGQGRGNSNIAAAEYFLDATGANGTGTAMSASDGAFNSKTENVTATLTAAQWSSLSQGTHTLFVHGKDAAGNWDGFASATFTKATPVIGSFNSSPNVLKLTTVTITVPATDIDSTTLTFSLSNSAPTWASIDHATGVLTLSPDIDATSSTFDVIVQDNAGGSASQTVHVSVYTAGVRGNNLMVYGTSGDNTITTTPSPTMVTVDGQVVPILLADGGVASSFDVLSSGGYIVIDAGNGTNTVQIGGVAPALVFGGSGADTITGGGGNDILAGGNGADVLDGGGGNDLLLGGPGPDTMSGGAGNNTIYGGRISASALDQLGLPSDIRDLLLARNDVVGGVTSDTDTLVESGDFGSWTLTNSSLDVGTIHDQLTSIEVANLTGGPSSNTFDVSGWTGGGSLSAAGGSDTLVASKDANFTLGDTSLVTSDGLNLTLSGIETANLTGGASPNSFALTGWTGFANIAAGSDAATVTQTPGGASDTITLGSSLAGLTITAGTITVNQSINAGSGGVRLTASAINVNAPITTSGGGNITLTADHLITASLGLTLNADGGNSLDRRWGGRWGQRDCNHRQHGLYPARRPDHDDQQHGERRPDQHHRGQCQHPGD